MEPINESGLIARIEQTTGLNLALLTQEIQAASVELGMLRSKVEALESFRTVVRAQAAERIRAEATESGERVTESRLSDMAHAAPEYTEHLRKQEAMREQLAAVEAEYYSLRNRREDAIEMMRFARSEMFAG